MRVASEVLMVVRVSRHENRKRNRQRHASRKCELRSGSRMRSIDRTRTSDERASVHGESGTRGAEASAVSLVLIVYYN